MRAISCIPIARAIWRWEWSSTSICSGRSSRASNSEAKAFSLFSLFIGVLADCEALTFVKGPLEAVCSCLAVLSLALQMHCNHRTGQMLKLLLRAGLRGAIAASILMLPAIAGAQHSMQDHATAS